MAGALVVYEASKTIPPLHERTREFELPASGPVSIEQDWAGRGGVGASVWAASLFLACYLEARVELRDRRVLELGAGCSGLASIAAARAGATVVATDGDLELVALLDRNVRAAGASPSFRGAMPLEWGADLEPALRRLGGAPDIVVAADLVYPGTKPYWPNLLRTLRALDRSPQTLILLAHTHRYQAVDDDFFALCDSFGFAATRLPLDGLPGCAHLATRPSILSLHLRRDAVGSFQGMTSS